MGKGGRPPKPTALHVLNGNPSKLNLKKRETTEPKPKPIAPKRPAWVTGEGKRMWDKLVPELERLGLFTAVDGEAFAAACHSWGTYVYCQKYLKKNGLTYEYENKSGAVNEIERPEVKIGQKALDHFRAFCSEFGLTPASRTRIEVKTPESQEDPTEALLSGVR
jgi:P27 family predicted phage terminase small subunit